MAELADKGRAPLAARAEMGDTVRGWVEWVDNSGNTIESIEVDALEQLGYVATWTKFGVRLTAGEHVIITTPSPHEVKVRDADPRLYRLDKGTGGAGIASAASEAGDAGGGRIEYTPGTRADVFPRNPAQTVESLTPATSGL